MTLFLTDTEHRFLCVRCHLHLAESRRQRAKVCSCAKVSECAICKQREYIWRWRQKNKERVAKSSREYHQWRREHLKQLEAKKNGRAKAART